MEKKLNVIVNNAVMNLHRAPIQGRHNAQNAIAINGIRRQARHNPDWKSRYKMRKKTIRRLPPATRQLAKDLTKVEMYIKRIHRQIDKFAGLEREVIAWNKRQEHYRDEVKRDPLTWPEQSILSKVSKNANNQWLDYMGYTYHFHFRCYPDYYQSNKRKKGKTQCRERENQAQ